MRRSITVAVVLASGLLLVPFALAQATWAQQPEAPAEISVPEPLSVVASGILREPRLTWRQRREMGLTFADVRKQLIAMHADGELEGLSATEVTAEVLVRLVSENPKAYKDGVDWDQIFNFLERVVALILQLIPLFNP